MDGIHLQEGKSPRGQKSDQEAVAGTWGRANSYLSLMMADGQAMEDRRKPCRHLKQKVGNKIVRGQWESVGMQSQYQSVKEENSEQGLRTVEERRQWRRGDRCIHQGL